MHKKILIYILCFISSATLAGQINKENSLTKSNSIGVAKTTHRVHLKNGLDKRIKIGQYFIALTRIDDRMHRIHLNSKPRNKSLIVEAFDSAGNKMKILKKGENLSTPSTSNHKYMYKSMPAYIDIK